ncbi:TSCPD domain-containing protein [Oecophyllibacter saccharovorans]|uniref:TSCPD domain-containing protein n=1 Tax=Oecophyllibacter saccharovorans TaxID=2558360 RepID=UPI001F4FF96F|nr:vitamin B12-dependent ribonucleotide reductase [Oecophyllibacter saccharovorans]
MRTLHISPAPDSPDPRDEIVRTVIVPASWEDAAAQALACLTPTEGGPVRLSSEAARWVDAIEMTPRLPGTPKEAPPVGRSLSCLLLMRQMAPNAALWQRRPDEQPGFVLRLAGFVQESSFATEQFIASLRLACESLRRLQADGHDARSGALPLFENLSPADEKKPVAGIVSLTDLDACLAALGLDYDSPAGREFASAVAALARQVAGLGTQNVQPAFSSPSFPDLEQVARTLEAHGTEALAGQQDPTIPAQFPLAPVETGFTVPTPTEALLGVESCGLAPIFSPVDDEGHLRPSTLARLAHLGLTPETALARALEGTLPFTRSPSGAQARMQSALAPFCDCLPPMPEPELEEVRTRLERGVRRPLPARQKGFSQRVSVGGHPLVMQTSQFSNGTLAALSLTPTRESPMIRGLMECLSQAVSIGLQFGAPLETFVAQFAHTRFGPCGTVEGDPAVAYASSMLDYAFRTLSAAYLDQALPDAAPEERNATRDPQLPFEENTNAPQQTQPDRGSPAGPARKNRRKGSKGGSLRLVS